MGEIKMEYQKKKNNNNSVNPKEGRKGGAE